MIALMPNRNISSNFSGLFDTLINLLIALLNFSISDSTAVPFLTLYRIFSINSIELFITISRNTKPILRIVTFAKPNRRTTKQMTNMYFSGISPLIISLSILEKIANSIPTAIIVYQFITLPIRSKSADRISKTLISSIIDLSLDAKSSSDFALSCSAYNPDIIVTKIFY